MLRIGVPFFLLMSFGCLRAETVLDQVVNYHQQADQDGIYYVGPEVSAPKLLRTLPAIYPQATPHHEVQGMTVMAAVIDAKGLPEHIELLHSHGKTYDQSAMYSLQRSTFVPAMLAGKAVPVWVDVRVVFRDDRSKAIPEVLITERDLPPPALSKLQDKNHNLLSYTEPLPIHTVDADFDDPFARRPYVQVELVTVLVGTDGQPKDVRVVRGITPGLDKKAAAAVWHYRFLPATKKGNIVEARRNIEVPFSLF